MACVFKSSVLIFRVDDVLSPSQPRTTNKKSEAHLRWIYFENTFLDSNFHFIFVFICCQKERPLFGKRTIFRLSCIIMYLLTIVLMYRIYLIIKWTSGSKMITAMRMWINLWEQKMVFTNMIISQNRITPAISLSISAGSKQWVQPFPWASVQGLCNGSRLWACCPSRITETIICLSSVIWSMQLRSIW